MRKILALLLLLASPAWGQGISSSFPGPGTPHSSGGGGSLSVVQSTGTTANSSSLVLSLTTTSGNLLVLDVHQYNGALQTYTVSDSLGNTWTAAYAAYNPGSSGTQSRQFYAKNITGGSDTITVSFAGGVFAATSVTEVRGADTTAPLDLHEQTLVVATSTPSFTTSGTTAQANEIVFGVAAENTASTAGTMDSNYVSQFNNTPSVLTDEMIGTRIVSATGTQTFAPTWGVGLDSNIIITTYKAAP